jgi:excisionase family DNA binding protein
MTVTEAAAKLGVKPVTVRAAIERGRMRATKHGPNWWVTDSAVETYRSLHLGKPGRSSGKP